MKFIFVISLAFTAITSTVALTRDPAVIAALDNRKGIESREPVGFDGGALTKRVCTKSSCNCSGYAPGLFCGDGYLNCVEGNVYQCSTDGHITCSYGPRTSCQKCGELSC